MKETWRWYGELDRITLSQISQTGAKGIVTALHNVAYGEVWPIQEISLLKSKIENCGLSFTWDVVESLPVHENIKMGKGNLTDLFNNYRKSLRHLADSGVKIICYNFMPILDWTRTHLNVDAIGGGTALRFSAPHMAAFEIVMLGRNEARLEYTTDSVQAGLAWVSRASATEKNQLLTSIMAGLPGKFTRYSVEGLRKAISLYEDIDKNRLRKNYSRFLDEIIPTAERLGIKMCVHPDDPPRDILGLPRIVSSIEDLEWLFGECNSEANGLTLCSGSFGAGVNNNVIEIAKQFSQRIHFAHLRNVKKDADGSFEEVAHLSGDTNMAKLVSVLIKEEVSRFKRGKDFQEIPFRPDHGHELLWDKDNGTHPGYPLIGRLRGLAELRGVIHGLTNVN